MPSVTSRPATLPAPAPAPAATFDGTISRPSQLLEAIFAAGRKGLSIARYKGLGEMNAEQLWETTLNPDTRRLLPVQLGDMDFAATEGLITKLMGKGEAAARRELMELHGDAVEIDI